MKTLIKILGVCFLSFISFGETHAQVWPGDVNENGVVNHFDLLYLGAAYGATGPARVAAANTWSPMIGTQWAESFPDGTNYAHADCNGDGIVDFLDYLTVIINYGHVHGNPTIDYFPDGEQYVDPPLALNGGFSDPVMEGTTIYVDLNLGDLGLEVIDFNGLAFSLNFSDDMLIGNPVFAFGPSWVNNGNELLVNQQESSTVNGQIDVSISRYANPVSGQGPIGTIELVIEDNVVDVANPNPVLFLSLSNAVAVTTEFDTIPLYTNSIPVYITNSLNVLDTKDLKSGWKVFPNPASDWLFLESTNKEMEEVNLYNSLGQKIEVPSSGNAFERKLNTKDLPLGIYFLEVKSDREQLLEKIIIE